MPDRNRASRWGIYGNRSFRVYWAGGLVSNVGTWVQNVTASVVMLNLTHSPLMVGVLNLATFSPILFLSMIGGMVSDRFDRRRVIVWSQAFSLLVAVAITALAATDRLSSSMLLVLSALLGCSYAVAKPALSALLPSLVERGEIANATAVNTLQFNLGQVIGSALSAVLLAVSSATVAFTVNSASFLGPIIAMYLLRNAELNDGRRRGPLRGSGKEGLALAMRTPAILALLVAVALSNAPVEALRTLAPELTQHSMGLTAGAAGVLVTAYSIGSTVGLLAFGWLSAHLRPRILLASAFGAQAVGLLGVSLVSSLVPAAVVALPIGLGFATNIPLLSAGLQVLSPEDFRGRVMSMFSMIHLGLRPFFSLSAGALATVLDARIALVTFVVFPVAAITLTARSARALATATQGPGDPVRSA